MRPIRSLTLGLAACALLLAHAQAAAGAGRKLLSANSVSTSQDPGARLLVVAPTAGLEHAPARRLHEGLPWAGPYHAPPQKTVASGVTVSVPAGANGIGDASMGDEQSTEDKVDSMVEDEMHTLDDGITGAPAGGRRMLLRVLAQRWLLEDLSWAHPYHNQPDKAVASGITVSVPAGANGIGDASMGDEQSTEDKVDGMVKNEMLAIGADPDGP